MHLSSGSPPEASDKEKPADKPEGHRYADHVYHTDCKEVGMVKAEGR